MHDRRTQLQIVVAHSLPGRLRLRFSHPPRNTANTVQRVKSHPGVESVAYSTATENLLVFFDPDQVSLEEIILRASLCLSADYDLKSVLIRSSTDKVPLSVLAVFSGISLLVAHLLSRIALKTSTINAVELLAGLGTTAAVTEHIYLDLKTSGRLDPEVLSIGYLFSAILQGKMLKGATVSWLMTFVRHLMEPPQKVVKLDAAATDPACDDTSCEYEATISRELTVQGYTGLLARVPQIVLGMYTDMNLSAEDQIFKEIQNISRKHNDVLEGLENLHRGIRLQVDA